jgi:long-subunit fatty acid transport protein
LLRDSLVFSLGGYYARTATVAGLAPSGGGSGVAIDFEETLDLDKRNLTPMGGFMWRFSERWRMEVEYFAVGRDATRTLATQIQWGDQTFAAGTTVDSTFDFSDLRLSAAYSFFKRRDKELGIGLGLHVSGIKASLDGEGIGAEAADVTAPLPVVNLYGLFALTDEWAVRMRVDWLSLTYGDYSGDVRGIGLDVLYQPFRHIGFGLGVRSLMMDITIEDPDWRGEARMSYSGPTLFMTASF